MSGILFPSLRAAKARTILLAQITPDAGLQMREKMDRETVLSYIDALAEGNEFPPVTVYEDAPNQYWLADGFHRVEAHRRLGRESIQAEVRPGNRDQALLHAAGANATNGLRRTNADKRKAVETLLRHPLTEHESNHTLAKLASVSHTYVANIRRDLTGEAGDSNVATEPLFPMPAPPAPQHAQTAVPARPVLEWPDDPARRMAWACECRDLDQLALAIRMPGVDIPLRGLLSVRRSLLEDLAAADSPDQALYVFLEKVRYTARWPVEPLPRANKDMDILTCQRIDELAEEPMTLPASDLVEIDNQEVALRVLLERGRSLDDRILLLEIACFLSLLRNGTLSPAGVALPAGVLRVWARAEAEKSSPVRPATPKVTATKTSPPGRPEVEIYRLLRETSGDNYPTMLAEQPPECLEAIRGHYNNMARSSPESLRRADALRTWLSGQGVEFSACPNPQCSALVIADSHCPVCRVRAGDARLRWIDLQNQAWRTVRDSGAVQDLWAVLDEIENRNADLETCQVCDGHLIHGRIVHTSQCPWPKAATWIRPLQLALAGKNAIEEPQTEPVEAEDDLEDLGGEE